MEGRIQFLLDICINLDRAYTDEPKIATADSITFLASRTRIWRRWVANYNTRTKIRIDLFFNLANQNDSRNNIEIAALTKDIAQETRKDSSSMITIAVLTMLFLPGTFLSVRLPQFSVLRPDLQWGGKKLNLREHVGGFQHGILLQ